MNLTGDPGRTGLGDSLRWIARSEISTAIHRLVVLIGIPVLIWGVQQGGAYLIALNAQQQALAQTVAILQINVNGHKQRIAAVSDATGKLALQQGTLTGTVDAQIAELMRRTSDNGRAIERLQDRMAGPSTPH